MMSGFSHPMGNTLHRVELFFKYKEDESTILISGVGYTALLNDPDWVPPF